MYNYVFFNEGFDELDKLFYLDIEEYKNVKIINRNRIFNNSLTNLLFRVHFSHNINSMVKIPFKYHWFKKIFKNDFPNDSKLCFVFTAGWYHPEFFNYLKKNFNNSRFVFYFSDTVESKLKAIPSLSIDYLKDSFDLVLSYNHDDVQKYNLKFTSIYYSKASDSWIQSIPNFDSVDVLYIGAARNRLDKIRKAYEKFKNAGLNCYFYVVSDLTHETYNDGIHYSVKAMPFKEYLGRTMSTKCILEIVDTNTTGSTLRFWEAIMYDKKLITNFKFTKNSKFYNPDYIHYYSSIEDINPDFVTNGHDPLHRYNNENSPIHFLKLIDEYLSIEKV